MSTAHRALLYRCIDVVKVLASAVQPDICSAAAILRQRIDNFTGYVPVYVPRRFLIMINYFLNSLLIDVGSASLQSTQKKPILSRLRLKSGGRLDHFNQQLDDAYRYFEVGCQYHF
jgi:hypothetical protein